MRFCAPRLWMDCMDTLPAEPVAPFAPGKRADGQVSRIRRFVRAHWVDIAWMIFIALNLAAMRFITAWQTVPFLIIWLSLTTLYGFRLWRLGSTVLTVLVVTVLTGGLIGWQVLRGKQDLDYLAEVPLLATMFVVMAWHSRRRLAAMDEIKRVSEHNLRLLDLQRQFLQDVSHELGTPITIALGHTELITMAATDQEIAKDAQVAVDELHRMRRLASRMMLLAATDGPDFLHLTQVDVAEFLMETLKRWSQTPRRWTLGSVTDSSLQADHDRLTLALDALIENAVDHHRGRRPNRAERPQRCRERHHRRHRLGIRHPAC
jgi:signal transduction histidine kinase